MKNVKSSRAGSRVLLSCLLFVTALLSVACSSSNDPAPFQLLPTLGSVVLVEGSASGVSVPIEIARDEGHEATIQLSLKGATDDDEKFLSSSFTQSTLTANEDSSQLLLSLAIADLPIVAQQRELRVTANDGTNTHDTTLFINVVPVDAPDIYLLVGQSNMVGFSGNGTREAFEGGADETNIRIKQLNVSSNDQLNTFLDEFDFTSTDLNAGTPIIVTATDPLHVELTPENFNFKSEEYIGLGLSFAKAALSDTNNDIILVPAAWSGSAFCQSAADGPPGQWNAEPTSDPALGNTWLFDRAVTRADMAIQETGGILRGILWHQGESDANEACAPSYAANLERLVQQLRMRITPDARGGDLRRNDSNIPFVVGTMSRGEDERGDLSQFSTAKTLIDNAHKNLPNVTSFSALSNHDDLVPPAYPCGNTSCIHFGAEALREMGNRYYSALLRAAAQ